MSGHQRKHNLSESELDDLLAEALANAKVKARLARPFILTTQYDIAMLGSSSIGGRKVHLDRHLRFGNRPFGVLMVKGRPIDTKWGLIRHERLEQALEDELGWPYDRLAHPVAQHWEEQDYKAKGFDPEDVEAAFEPYIKHDEAERITRTPLDLDMRPLLAAPRSTVIIDRIKALANKEKRPHEAVGYLTESERRGQACDKCAMFIQPEYGGPGCVGVQDPILPGGWCRRFKRGTLGGQK